MSADIQMKIDIRSAPRKIYDTLLDGKLFAAFTGGGDAEIDATEGGAFSCFGGRIVGRNIQLKPGQRIVQAWRTQNWPDGQFSIVRFELAKTNSGTTLTMDHSGVPDGQLEHLTQGWTAMYWDPLTKYLG